MVAGSRTLRLLALALLACSCEEDPRPFEFGPEPPPPPRQLGQPCEFLGVPCDEGLLCLGDLVADNVTEGVCMVACGAEQQLECPPDHACMHVDVCAVACDPLLQDCEPGWACAPDFETGAGACVPALDAGLLEPCLPIAGGCRAGLTCDPTILDYCVEPLALACCTQICDPGAVDPGCPFGLLTCEPLGVLGVCRD